MRMTRWTWLLIALLLIGVYFVQHNPHSARAQGTVARSIPVIGGVTAATQMTFSGLWRVDGNFESTIHIKNSLVVAPVQVTPVLYMADGTEYDLAPVIIPTTGTSVVSVNRALAQAPPGVQAHLSSYGSAALRYRGIPMSVAGVIDMLDAPRSLLFSASFMMPMMTQGMKDATQTLEGLWWRRKPGVGGFVSFANTTGKTVSVTFQVIGSEGTALPTESLSLSAYSTQMLDLDRLTLGLPGLENQAGGIRVQWQGSAADLAVTGGLEDAREGFSSNMQFWSHNLMAQPAPSTMAAVGLMTGEPDPSLGYPSGTRFTPYAVLRNSTSTPLSVRLVVHETSGTGSFSLPLRVLKPLETVRVEVTKALAGAARADTGGTLNLVLSYTGRPGDLVVDTLSVSHIGNYTMPAPVQLLDETLSQVSPFWTVADGFDTMYMLWNWTDQAEDVVVTLYYSDGSGHFKLPVHLAAQGSATIDMAKVIAAGQPDVDGNVIPVRARGGSAVFASPKGVTSPMHLSVCGMHFSAQLGVAEACCICCSGYCGLFITPSPTYCPVVQSIQLKAQSYYSDGTLHDFTGSSNWSSSNTGIGTVETTGQTTPGWFTAVAVGSCTITASRSLTAQGVHLVGCGACPGVQVMTDQATANVTPTITVSCSPTHLATGSSAPVNTKNGSCSTSVNPSGGTFTWKVNTNTLTLTPSGATASYTAASKSASYGDTVISVTYSFNSQLGFASSSTITVHQPTSLAVDSDNSGLSHLCTVYALAHPGDGTCNTSTSQTSYSAPMRQRQYSVLDQFSPPNKFESVGLSAVAVTEQVPFTSTCPLTLPPASAKATPFLDSYYMCSSCCLPQGPGCTAKTNPVQTISVNNLTVRTETINWSCTGATLSP